MMHFEDSHKDAFMSRFNALVDNFFETYFGDTPFEEDYQMLYQLLVTKNKRAICEKKIALAQTPTEVAIQKAIYALVEFEYITAKHYFRDAYQDLSHPEEAIITTTTWLKNIFEFIRETYPTDTNAENFADIILTKIGYFILPRIVRNDFPYDAEIAQPRHYDALITLIQTHDLCENHTDLPLKAFTSFEKKLFFSWLTHLNQDAVLYGSIVTTIQHFIANTDLDGAIEETLAKYCIEQTKIIFQKLREQDYCCIKQDTLLNAIPYLVFLTALKYNLQAQASKAPLLDLEILRIKLELPRETNQIQRDGDYDGLSPLSETSAEGFLRRESRFEIARQLSATLQSHETPQKANSSRKRSKLEQDLLLPANTETTPAPQERPSFKPSNRFLGRLPNRLPILTEGNVIPATTNSMEPMPVDARSFHA